MLYTCCSDRQGGVCVCRLCPQPLGAAGHVTDFFSLFYMLLVYSINPFSIMSKASSRSLPEGDRGDSLQAQDEWREWYGWVGEAEEVGNAEGLMKQKK